MVSAQTRYDIKHGTLLAYEGIETRAFARLFVFLVLAVAARVHSFVGQHKQT